MKRLMMILACLVLFSGTASAAQLLSNPSFEIGNLDDWTLGYGSAYATTANPSNGSNNARTHYDFGLNQEVAVVGGTNYTISADACVPSGGEEGWSSWINLEWLNATHTKIGATAWEVNPDLSTRDVYNSFASGSLAAPSNAAYAKVNLGLWANDGAITPADPLDWDNFSLDGQPIPEPTTLVLLGTGLVGLFGFVRRKRS